MFASESPSLSPLHETVTVDLGPRSYPIHIGAGLLKAANQFVKQAVGDRPCVIVSDSHVAALYAQPLYENLSAAQLCKTRPLVLPAGEKTKSFSFIAHLLRDVLHVGIDRNSVLVALGGGVIGDVTGFAAAIALRGIDFIQIPTSLLAQVDSSVGGKTGINTGEGKNLVGAFHQPRLVLTDVNTLKTLPLRELRAGYAEIVKMALLGDAAFFEFLESNGKDVVEGKPEAQIQAIKTSCAMKAFIVGRDEREGGERALLNLGHTFAHAFETATQYDGSLLHGEAVAMGCTLAFKLSARLGLCREEDAARVKKHFAACGLPTGITGRGWNADHLLANMYKDKKAEGKKLTFILARSIGQAVIAKDVDAQEVLAVLRDT